jgi:hypothetical protein
VPYYEYERFSYDHFNPKGMLSHSIQKMQKHSRQILKVMDKLKSKVSIVKQDLQQIEALAESMKREDKKTQEYYRKKLERGMSKWLRPISIVLGTASGIFALMDGGATYAATTAALAAVGNLTSGFIDENKDKKRRAHDHWQAERLPAYQNLAQTARQLQNEMYSHENQLQQNRNFILNNSGFLDTKGRREGLQSLYNDNQKAIDDLNEEWEKRPKGYLTWDQYKRSIDPQNKMTNREIGTRYYGEFPETTVDIMKKSGKVTYLIE